MIKFTALNESTSKLPDENSAVLVTKEAQEEEAYSLYHKALEFQTDNHHEEAEEAYKQLLQMDFISQAESKEMDESPMAPALVLKYLTYKNMGGMAYGREDYSLAMESYIEAVNIDSSDVSLWFKIGTIALKLNRYPLARLAFQEGLKCNSNHWQCLDNIITVLYVLGDYPTCLYFIAQALEKNSGYVKGLAFRDQIFKEHPGLRSYSDVLFKDCDPCVYTVSYDDEEGRAFINEGIAMREKKRDISKSPPLPVLKFLKPLQNLTWKCLGEALISLYDFIANSDPRISFGCRIDLSDYIGDSTKGEKDTPTSQSLPCTAPSHTDQALFTSAAELQTSSLFPATSRANALAHSEQPGSSVEKSTPMELEDPAAVTSDVSVTGNNVEGKQPQESTPCSEMMGNAGRRGSKRKRLIMENPDPAGKRRSARVRNTLRKHQENVNYQELLCRFLPSTLECDEREDDDDSIFVSQDGRHGDHTYGHSAEPSQEVNHELALQDEDKLILEDNIVAFLHANQKNSGVNDLLYCYLVELAKKIDMLWPQGLTDVYVECYSRLRKHLVLPSLFCQDAEDIIKKAFGFMTLAFSEFRMDKWQTETRGHVCSSPSMPVKGYVASSTITDPDFLDATFQEDQIYLLQLQAIKQILGDDWQSYVIRVQWLQTRLHILEGNVDSAVCCLDKITTLLQDLEKESKLPARIQLVNCASFNVITVDYIQDQLMSLQRCQSIEEVHRLYEQGDYESVVNLLIPIFRQSRMKKKKVDDSMLEKLTQLLLLQDSLWKLKDFVECLKWGEVALNEALNITSTATKVEWANAIIHLLVGINRCITNDKNVLNSLEESKLVRLTHNIIRVVTLQMDVYESASEMAIHTVLPWILLYRIIEQSEEKIQTLAAKSQSALNAQSDVSDPANPSNTSEANTQEPAVGPGENGGSPIGQDIGPAMPSSLMLLFTAHEYLGRRSWCSVSDGALLLLCVDVMLQELKKYNGYNRHPFKDDLEMGLEQCFYCLYGHPNKRAKAKHLQEHNAQQISLTWERSIQIFHYFRPSVLPEFDSYRTSTVSAELENLLRRISCLVPREEDPTLNMDSVIAYVEGGTDLYPEGPVNKVNHSSVVVELYYLLADHYFKNKEFGKAIKFYVLDICITPDRFDSWAGMALARSSQLEQKLSTSESRSETTFFRKAASALRCFKRALDLDPGHTSLWIEYGSLAYMLHSHASRQLKQESQYEVSSEIRELLQNKRTEMLQTACHCFKSASQTTEEGIILEEVWLHHYMLGKIAEKRRAAPRVYLEHYMSAAQHLYEDGAHYPRKIQYHNPPELAIEALEVYYRIHACTLKLLLKYENGDASVDDLKLLNEFLQKAAESPFVNFQEKRDLEKDMFRYPPSSSEAEESCTGSPINKKKSKKSVTIAATNDHTYFQQEQVEQVKQIPEEPITQANAIREHRPSIDSSSESQDSAAVKDVLNSIVTVVTERCPLSVVENSIQRPTIVLGDHKIRKTPVVVLGDRKIRKTPVVVLKPLPKDIKKSITLTGNEEILKKIDVKLMGLKENAENKSTEKVMEMDADKAVSPTAELEAAGATDVNTNDPCDVVSEQSCVDESETKNVNSDAQMQVDNPTSVENAGSDNTPSDANEHVQTVENIPLTSETQPVNAENTVSDANAKDSDELKVNEADTDMLAEQLTSQCLNAMKECLQRFPQHYKSLYRLSHYYCHSPKCKNLQWSKDILLGNLPWQVANSTTSPGLFAERKNTNFFNGIWRIPIDEIDRPGSFASHMYRSVVLLVDVLQQLKDLPMLVHLAVQLSRIPDLGKKYLRDSDRAYLAHKVFDICINVLRKEMNSLLCEEPPPEESRFISCLLNIYRAWQAFQKAAVFAEEANNLLQEAYSMYKLGEVDPYPPLIEQAINFCQSHLAKQASLDISKLHQSVGLPSSRTTSNDGLEDAGVVN